MWRRGVSGLRASLCADCFLRERTCRHVRVCADGQGWPTLRRSHTSAAVVPARGPCYVPSRGVAGWPHPKRQTHTASDRLSHSRYLSLWVPVGTGPRFSGKQISLDLLWKYSFLITSLCLPDPCHYALYLRVVSCASCLILELWLIWNALTNLHIQERG